MHHTHLDHSHQSGGNLSGMSSGKMGGMSGGSAMDGHGKAMSSGMGQMHMDGMDMQGMMMYFHSGFTEYVLFEKAHTTTKGEFAAACVVVLVVAVLYELLKFYRDKLIQQRMETLARIRLEGSPEEKGKISSPVRMMFSPWHALQTLLHALQISVSYLLMLVVMTYNVYLALCVLLGSALGYFLIGWKRTGAMASSDQSEHCH